MPIHGKLLYNTNIIGILEGKDLNIGVYGIFDTEKVLWSYYIISYNVVSNVYLTLSHDICSVPYNNFVSSYDNIKKYGRKVQSVLEGENYCMDFKIKWETGSNSTTAEMREQKLNELLK